MLLDNFAVLTYVKAMFFCPAAVWLFSNLWQWMFKDPCTIIFLFCIVRGEGSRTNLTHSPHGSVIIHRKANYNVCWIQSYQTRINLIIVSRVSCKVKSDICTDQTVVMADHVTEWCFKILSILRILIETKTSIFHNKTFVYHCGHSYAILSYLNINDLLMLMFSF